MTTPIGTARVEPDGTLVLTLTAQLDDGGLGQAQLRYPQDHPDYARVRAHIGDLAVGDEVPVMPFDD